MTNTKVKFLMIVESSNVNLRDNDIKGVSINVHKRDYMLDFAVVLQSIFVCNLLE